MTYRELRDLISLMSQDEMDYSVEVRTAGSLAYIVSKESFMRSVFRQTSKDVFTWMQIPTFAERDAS